MRLVRIRRHTCNSGMGVACYALRQKAGLETCKLLTTLPSKGESLNKARQFPCLFPCGATESSGPGWAAETFLLGRAPAPTPSSQSGWTDPGLSEDDAVAPHGITGTWEGCVTNSSLRRPRRGTFQPGLILRKGGACRCGVSSWCSVLADATPVLTPGKLRQQLFVAMV